MARLFENGFEEGSTSAYDSQILANGTLIVQSTWKHAGNYALQAHTTPTLAAANAQVRKNLATAQAEVYIRAYAYITSGPTLMTSNDRFYLIATQCTDNQGPLIGLRREASAPLAWVMWYRRGTTPNFGIHTYSAAVDPANMMNRWLCLELHYNKNTGVQELYVDGMLTIHVDPTVDPLIVPTQLTLVTQAMFGINKSGASGSAYDPTGQYDIDAIMDDVVIGQEYVGPTTLPPTNPTLTVNSSPEINTPVYVDGVFVGTTPVSVQIASGTHIVHVESEVTR